MKKIFIGLAAVAAMGVSALCFSIAKSPEILSENVSALTEAYCVYQPESTCILKWSDGDYWEMEGFMKIVEANDYLMEIYLQHKELAGN